MSYQSDDDDAVFVPQQFEEESESARLKMLREDQNKILERYEEELSEFIVAQECMEKLKKQKQKELRHAQYEVRSMQEQINVYRTRKANLIFQYEQVVARSMSKTWFVVTILTLAMTLHFYHTGVYLLVLLNGAAFLANWRMLYVLNAKYSSVFGIGVLLFSWVVGVKTL